MPIDEQQAKAERDTLRSIIDRGIDVYYEKYERQLQDFDIERNALREHIAGLVVENGRLRSQLASAQPRKDRDVLNLAPTTQASGTAAFDDLFVSKQDYEALQQRHNNMRVEYQQTLVKYSAYKKTFHDMKRRVRDWQAYIRKKDKKDEIIQISSDDTAICQDRTADTHGSYDRRHPLESIDAIRDRCFPTPPFPSGDGMEDSNKRPVTPLMLEAAPHPSMLVFPSPTSSIPDGPRLSSSATGYAPVGSEAGQTAPPSRTGAFPMTSEDNAKATRPFEQLSSSQTTQDDDVRHVDALVRNSARLATSEANLPQEDNDLPVIVFEKALRRRKRVRDVSVYEDATASKKIKHESRSSPLVPSLAQKVLTRLDTFDLDHGVQTPDTPRKHTEVELLRQAGSSSSRAHAFRSLRNERSGSLPAEFAIGAVAAIPDDRHLSEPVGEVDEAAGRHVDGGGRVALHNISPNPHVRELSSRSASNLKLPRSHRRGASQIAIVTEDGEAPYMRRGLRTNIPRNNPPASGEEGSRRLRSLLDVETPQKQTLSFQRTAATSGALQRAATQDISGDPNHRPQSAPAKQRIKQEPETLIIPNTHEKDLWNGTPSNTRALRHTALRHRPIQALDLSHFKINPAFNQGLTHAHAETVRDRDARRCLPGCTRSECCGNAFSALVAAGVQPEAPRVLFGSSQPDQSETAEEERLLRHYLGDAYRHDMTQDYRREMLVKARSELLAKDCGRHKQTYERQRSPPGYWETGMPDTQTVVKNREMANELERATVQERYREAMRSGGKWLFQDE